MNRLPILLGIALLVIALPALAQSATLDPFANPTSGMAVLTPPFSPEPFIVSLSTNGNVNVSTLSLGADCRGFAASAPDYRLQWGGDGSVSLRLFFVGDGDSALVVNRPDGQWACNDDFASDNLNPFVDIANAPPGPYDIWVGRVTTDAPIAGYLMIAQGDSNPVRIVAPLLGGLVDAAEAGGGTAGLDISLEPNFGSVELGPGFTLDPHTVFIVSGGSVDISTLNLGPECLGFASASPDYRLVLTGTVSRLRIFFVGEANGDTTLAVNVANGTWACSDDAAEGTVNPMVELADAPAGLYDIWVGSFNTGATVEGTLYITEQDFSPLNLPTG